MQSIAEILSQELKQKQEYVENVIALLDEGNTIPFIARYRKEMHGTMDDTTLRTLESRLKYSVLIMVTRCWQKMPSPIWTLSFWILSCRCKAE